MEESRCKLEVGIVNVMDSDRDVRMQWGPLYWEVYSLGAGSADAGRALILSELVGSLRYG